MTQTARPPLPSGSAPRLRDADLTDLFQLALTGWMPASAGAGLEALFDRMEAAR